MYLYCERIALDKNSNTYEAVMDFQSEKDLYTFADLFKLQIQGENQSIVILSGLKFEKYLVLRAGYWYDIPLSILQNEFVIQDFYEGNSRILIGLKYKSNNLLNDRRYRIKFVHADTNKIEQVKLSESKHLLHGMINKFQTNLELFVRDVGCGNWNEVRNDSFWLIYDLGADIKFKDIDMRRIFSRIKFTQKYIGIISHWDLDHYRAILDLDTHHLSLMKFILVPTKIPDTVQFKQSISRLRNLGIPIISIPPSTRSSRRKIDLKRHTKFYNFLLYRSTDGSSINQSGIVLKVEGNSKIAVLTGDHHYRQLYKTVVHTKTQKPYEFVVPHHAGNAGRFNQLDWNRISFTSGAISTRQGRYKNLPRNYIHNYFRTGKGFFCTDCIRDDYNIPL